MRVSILALLCSLLVASSLAASSSEIQALNDFYTSTNGPYWTNKNNWGFGDPCTNKWFGISCDTEGNVVGIKLYYNSVRGTIPSSFGDLTNLVDLAINSNDIYGDFPESLTSLTKLITLDLSYNSLYGTIPSSVSNMSSLTSFNLNSNRLTGTIPASFANVTSLNYLSLSYNKLGGAFPVEILNALSGNNLVVYAQNNNLNEFDWASWIQTETTGNLVIYLASNLLSGNLTEQIYWPKSISLSSNYFTGPIPERTSSAFSPLTYLNLNGNFLTGNVPASIASNTLLAQIDVGYNTKLAGELPLQIASMPYLTSFYFYSTGLTCPQGNAQWDDFQDRATTSCPYNYHYSSYSYHNYTWIWITVGYISGILFIICLASLIVFFATRKRRVVIIAQ